MWCDCGRCRAAPTALPGSRRLSCRPACPCPSASPLSAHRPSGGAPCSDSAPGTELGTCLAAPQQLPDVRSPAGAQPARPWQGLRTSAPSRDRGGGGREERHLCPAKGHPGGRATRWAQLLQGGGAGPGREAQSGPRRLHKGDSWGGGLPEGHRCREWGLCLGAGACSRQWGSWEGDRTQGWALEDAGQGLGGCPESGCGWPERAPPLAPAEVSAWWEGAGPWGWKREAEQDPSPNTRHQQQSQGNLRREAPQRLPLTSPPAGPRPQAGRGGGGHS